MLLIIAELLCKNKKTGDTSIRKIFTLV